MGSQTQMHGWMDGCLSGWIVDMMDRSLGTRVDGWTQTDG